jgi:glycerophosphoryl diester phosphodiesterase
VTTPVSRRSPRRVRAWLHGPERPWVLGHRGARRRAPENTLAAFDLAREEGADGVELDVRLDRDGDVVVAHDDVLGRVTAGRDTRRIDALGRRELSRVDLGGGERVPRLEDVLRWARQHRMRVNVELKRDVAHRTRFVLQVARLVAMQPGAASWVIFSSFDPLLVAAIARLVPWVSTGWLVEPPHGVPGRTLAERLVGATAVNPKASLVTAASIAPWQSAGLPVNVWTVNDGEEARRLAGLGVDTLISDVPGEILAALGAR